MMKLRDDDDLRETRRGGQRWRRNLVEDDELDQALMVLQGRRGSEGVRGGYGSLPGHNDLGGKWREEHMEKR